MSLHYLFIFLSQDDQKLSLKKHTFLVQAELKTQYQPLQELKLYGNHTKQAYVVRLIERQIEFGETRYLIELQNPPENFHMNSFLAEGSWLLVPNLPTTTLTSKQRHHEYEIYY